MKDPSKPCPACVALVESQEALIKSLQSLVATLERHNTLLSREIETLRVKVKEPADV
jgi:hypothetical protein